MAHKLKSEMSSRKIDISACIIFGSLTFLEGFVILNLVIEYFITDNSNALVLLWLCVICIYVSFGDVYS